MEKHTNGKMTLKSRDCQLEHISGIRRPERSFGPIESRSFEEKGTLNRVDHHQEGSQAQRLEERNHQESAVHLMY